MGFASAWLQERAIYPRFINEQPDKNTGIIVVIPAYNEPEICSVLDSVASCSIPQCAVEVLVVINAPGDAPDEHVENNRTAALNIESWKKANKDVFFRLYFFQPEPVQGWGVGLARKTGMDEALRRFDRIGCKEGVILSLDADCTVESNYLNEICAGLFCKKERKACSIYFEHHTGESPDQNRKAITLYELHLRYYLQGLIYSGFPYVFHTVGSAMAVKALAYMKAGGMNRKQAGEDFYLIQKLVSQGGYFSLNSTAVYPSARKSGRVPFGTGAMMEKLLSMDDPSLLTYNVRAFEELKSLFSGIGQFFSCNEEDIEPAYNNLPEGVRLFIPPVEWVGKITEIRQNTSGPESFRKRFFSWFNMFRIVKYLNSAHGEYLVREPVEKAASEMLKIKGLATPATDPGTLLDYYRYLEKS